MVGGIRFEALLALLEENNVSSAVRCGTDRLLCCLIVHVGIHASEISISLSLVRVKSYVIILFNPDRVPVRASVNELSCPKADNVWPHWRLLKRLRFGFVKAVYPYRAP